MLTNDNHHVTPAGSIGEETLLRNVTCARLTPTQPHINVLTYLSPKRSCKKYCQSGIAPLKKQVKKQGEEIQRITSGAPTQHSGLPEEPWDTNP